MEKFARRVAGFSLRLRKGTQRITAGKKEVTLSGPIRRLRVISVPWVETLGRICADEHGILPAFIYRVLPKAKMLGLAFTMSILHERGDVAVMQKIKGAGFDDGRLHCAVDYLAA